jgi:hypothetical protein
MHDTHSLVIVSLVPRSRQWTYAVCGVGSEVFLDEIPRLDRFLGLNTVAIYGRRRRRPHLRDEELPISDGGDPTGVGEPFVAAGGLAAAAEEDSAYAGRLLRNTDRLP